jgi:hypothetical protein
MMKRCGLEKKSRLFYHKNLINSKTSYFNKSNQEESLFLKVNSKFLYFEEVLDLIKQLVGVETFSDLYSISNKKRSERRDER